MSEKDKILEETKSLIAVEIPDSLRKKLKFDAYQNDISVSALIRSILFDYFDMDNDTKLLSIQIKSSVYSKLQDMSSEYSLDVPAIIELIVNDYIRRYKSEN